MEDPLYKIARQNLKNKKKVVWISALGVTFFLIFFSFWLSVDMEPGWILIFMFLILIMTFSLSFYYGRKIVGKRDPVLEEMKRLQETGGLDLKKREELILKELRPNYDEDDFV